MYCCFADSRDKSSLLRERNSLEEQWEVRAEQLACAQGRDSRVKVGGFRTQGEAKGGQAGMQGEDRWEGYEEGGR